MIGLLGATGYTGRLVAAELARRGLPHRLGARNESRLARVPVAPLQTRHLVDAAAVPASFLDGLDVLITTVGPFMRYGMPVADAAVAAGVPYVDSTGETNFMAAVYDRHAAAATPVVPACAFDYLPGDLAVAVAARDASGPVTDVRVTYDIRGIGVSRGTARSALDAMGSITVGRRSGDGVEFSWGEKLTVPRHLPGANVTTVVRIPPVAAPALAAAAAAGRVAAPLLDRLLAKLPEGPSEVRRAKSRFTLTVEVSGGARVVCEGRDVYRLSAVCLVEAALRVRGAGAMAPAQAMDPEATLDAISGELFSWRHG